MKNIFYFLLGLMLLDSQLSLAAGKIFSDCRFEESSLEIFGLAAYGYADLKEQAVKEGKEFSGWYLFRWKNKGGADSLVTQRLAVDSTGSAFNPAYELLKNKTKETHAYALVWEDRSQGTKYGKSATTLRINAGFYKGSGYDVFLDAKNINVEGVEVGCGVNLLSLN
ncbi:hypothetical protein [Microbulbifer sp.]|uniref:hypothetical protein n=1 Tax=Microbulbifer sp. TaxID=1908541 RepID=UPI003F2DFDDE